jgi:hypothetical protein
VPLGAWSHRKRRARTTIALNRIRRQSQSARVSAVATGPASKTRKRPQIGICEFLPFPNRVLRYLAWMFAMTVATRHGASLGTKTRRLPNSRLQELGAPTPGLSDDTIDRIIKAVGCAIPAERREMLRANLVNALEWGSIFTITQKAPARWEVAARLSSVLVAVEKLWQLLGITQKPNEIWKDTHLRTVDINPALWSPLHAAADRWGQEHEPELRRRMEMPEELATLGPMNLYSVSRMRDIVYALAMLTGWINTAQSQPVSKKRKDSARRKPDHIQLAITLYLAQTYEQVFEHPPTDSVNGPWLSFLEVCIFELTGRQLTREALRARWRRAKKAADPKRLNTQALHAIWQRAKELRALASG